MSDLLNWVEDPEEADMPEREAKIAKSGEVTIGTLLRSASGRYRWEIVALPGLTTFRDDRRGWEDSEASAKARVQDMWNSWLELAGGPLPPPPGDGQ